VQLASPSVSAPIRVVSDGDEGGSLAVAAEGEPVGPVDEDPADGGTGAQNGPVSVIESVPATGPAADTVEDGSSTSAELRPVSAVLGVSAESLPLTGFGLAATFLAGLLLLSSGAVVRRGGFAAG
jgi:hypothetical protein